MNLLQNAYKVFDLHSEKMAITEASGKAISFGEFAQKTHQAVNALKIYNIKKGSKVFLLLPVEIDLYIVIAALFKMGAMVIFIDPWSGKDYINRALYKVKPDVLMFATKALPLLLLKNIRCILQKISLKDFKTKMLNASTDSGPCEELSPDHSALITFTSGSSNDPKGFDRSHGFLEAQRMAHHRYFKHEADDIDLCMFPVFVLSNLASGISSVLIDIDLKKINDFDANKLYQQMIKFKITTLTCSPAILDPLCQYLIEKQKQLSGIKKLYTGGAPVHPLLFEDLKKVMPLAKLYLVYGSTEAEPMALLEATELLEHTKAKTLAGKGTVLGKVVDELRYKIINAIEGALTNYVEVAHGEVGEIIVSGPFVGKRYYQSEEAFRQNKIVEGDIVWHRTGDLGYVAENNILFMVGRLHNQVQEGPKTIYPVQIEAALEAKKYIKKAAYFQYDQTSSGLLIELTKGELISKAKSEIKNECSNLGINPEVIHFVKSIPKDPRHNAKIDVRKIKEVFSKASIEQEQKKSYFNKMFAYTQERFPLIATFIFVSLFAFDSFYLFQAINQDSVIKFNHFMGLSLLTMFCIFFHLRLLDEHKDFAQDKEVYPERVLSRGIVSFSDLNKTIVFLFVLEFIFNLYLGFHLGIMLFVVWGGIFLYTLLMYKEFFVHQFLKKHLTLYLVSHQIILPLMFYYHRLTVDNSKIFTTPNVVATLVLTSYSFYYEIARKTWAVEREAEGADSYTSAWGIKKTVIVLKSSLILIFSLLLYLGNYLNFSLVYQALIVLGLILCFSIIGKFHLNPSIKNSKLVELTGIIVLLGGHLLLICSVLSR